MTTMQDSIERVMRALDEIRAGKMVILVDDEDRENEGDLVMAADLCTPEAINFMAKFARGLICLPLTAERVDELELPMMVSQNRASRETAFTVSIEARRGVTTGISAADRCHTVLTAVDPDVRASDIVSPGHIFPLRAKPGGVLQRTGHTEGAVDLARLAGRAPAGVICEIMKDDGTMARYPDLVEFAKEHGLQILSIADMVAYRLTRERMVRPVRKADVLMPTGKTWTAHTYEVTLDERRQFLAMSYGTLTSDPTLVRVHTGSVLGDVFQVRMGERVHMSDAIECIEREGSGVILFIPGPPDPVTDIAFYLGEPLETARPEPGVVLREYGLGAQVLSGLGLSRIRILTNRPRRLPSLEGYHLEVVEQLLVQPGQAGEGARVVTAVPD
ncbi:MAG: 3,4-dihydroxy-2-butanone-4-phosphate synthase [Sandaracinaceae bacterium]|nr:3,4-dihydroxy-2-butanone-4-phosphate synthase [Myxococcales bacterium]MCB9658830.1 3,4-dihydroxy-2-butanone-4-phosphate synthase [Sandaracinaceae bacterium]